MERGDERGNLWSIVLAGGDGVRTKEFIRRWLGYGKPKQYCAFVGSRSMFQHTLDRAARLTPWERVVVVAARHHQHEVWPQLDGTARRHGAVAAKEHGHGRRRFSAPYLYLGA